MTSMDTAVFKTTIGLLVNQGKDQRLPNEGEITDPKYLGLIVRQIDDSKSKLDELPRLEDLLAGISFVEEGIELLYEVFEKARTRSEYGSITAQAAAGTDSDGAVSLAKSIKKLELTDMDESASRVLANAKKRFKDVLSKATEAFANEALELPDRVLAMQYRVMATILETLDNPADALPACRVCIEELHSLPAVQKSFKVELQKGFRARFGKNERREIISNVCHVNRVTYDVTLMVCFGNRELSNWPCVDIGKEKVNPLFDARISQTLQKQGMEHCCVTPWSLGQEGEEEHNLKLPWGVAINTQGHFIVPDNGDDKVKVFDSSGKFLYALHPQDLDTEISLILDVAADRKCNTYVLVRLRKPGSENVLVFSDSADIHHKFPLKEGDWYRLTVSDGNKVMVLGRPARTGSDVVDVYEIDSQFVRRFGEGILKDARDITAVNEDRVMVVGRMHSYVHVFGEKGDLLFQFNVQGSFDHPRISFHKTSGHVVVAGEDRRRGRLYWAVYSKEGTFVRSTELDLDGIECLAGIAVTLVGRIAVAFEDVRHDKKVLVV